MPQQLDWREAAAERGLTVTDLAEHLGTAIDGVDVGDEHDAEMVAILRAACVARTLLLFRGQQKLSPAAMEFGIEPALAGSLCPADQLLQNFQTGLDLPGLRSRHRNLHPPKRFTKVTVVLAK